MKRTFSIAALTAVLFTGFIASAQAAPARAHQAKPVAQQKAHAPAAHTKKVVHQKVIQKKVVQKKVVQKKAHASAHKNYNTKVVRAHKKAHKQQVAKNARRSFAHWTPNLKAKKYHGFRTARYYGGNYHVSAYNQHGVAIKLLVNAVTGVIIHASAQH